jgi:hypothetical protein
VITPGNPTYRRSTSWWKQKCRPATHPEGGEKIRDESASSHRCQDVTCLSVSSQAGVLIGACDSTPKADARTAGNRDDNCCPFNSARSRRSEQHSRNASYGGMSDTFSNMVILHPLLAMKDQERDWLMVDVCGDNVLRFICLPATSGRHPETGTSSSSWPMGQGRSVRRRLPATRCERLLWCGQSAWHPASTCAAQRSAAWSW